MKVDLETRLILSGIENDYQMFEQNRKKINWRKLLEKASFNRLLYQFVSNMLEQKEIEIPAVVMAKLQEILGEGKSRVDRLGKTLRFIDGTLGKEGIDFLIVKTFKLRPFVTNDVDVLLKKRDLERAFCAFSKNEATVDYFSAKRQWDVKKDGLLNIDTHIGFHWQRSKFIDDDLFWENLREIKEGGVTYYTPNLEADIAAVILNLIYESSHIPLLDYLYIRDNAERLEWSVIRGMAVRYNWIGAYETFVGIFESLSDAFYHANGETKRPFPSAVRKVRVKAPVSMPYIFSIRQGLSIFIERIVKAKYFPWHDIAYFVFAKTRWLLTRGRRIPMYYHWFPIDTLMRQ
jgi:hypothetical protein